MEYARTTRRDGFARTCRVDRSNRSASPQGATGQQERPVLGTYAVGAGPSQFTFDGTNIWISNEFNATVTKMVASTGSVVGVYSVGTDPTGLIYDGTNIWVANQGSSTVTKLLASTGAVSGHISRRDFRRVDRLRRK